MPISYDNAKTYLGVVYTFVGGKQFQTVQRVTVVGGPYDYLDH